MSTKELLDKAIKLKPKERAILVQGLIESLDHPDKKLDEIWTKEAEMRLRAYRAGEIDSAPFEEVFND